MRASVLRIPHCQAPLLTLAVPSGAAAITFTSVYLTLTIATAAWIVNQERRRDALAAAVFRTQDARVDQLDWIRAQSPRFTINSTRAKEILDDPFRYAAAQTSRVLLPALLVFAITHSVLWATLGLGFQPPPSTRRSLTRANAPAALRSPAVQVRFAGLAVIAAMIAATFAAAVGHLRSIDDVPIGSLGNASGWLAVAAYAAIVLTFQRRTTTRRIAQERRLAGMCLICGYPVAAEHRLGTGNGCCPECGFRDGDTARSSARSGTSRGVLLSAAAIAVLAALALLVVVDRSRSIITNRLLARSPHHDGPITTAYLFDGKVLLASTRDGTYRVVCCAGTDHIGPRVVAEFRSAFDRALIRRVSATRPARGTVGLDIGPERAVRVTVPDPASAANGACAVQFPSPLLSAFTRPASDWPGACE